MTFSDDDLLPISALQHLVYCRRQCMLIHGEQFWSENRWTAEGRVLHDRAHTAATTLRDGVLTARGLRLVSYRLGLSGVADVVEFHPAGPGVAGVVLSGRRGTWTALPVEYKRGRPKKHNADAVQLCAQALCIEEMLGVPVTAGALFYGKVRRRKDVALDAALRAETERLAGELHRLMAERATPSPEPGPKCKQCSLRGGCMPDRQLSAARYVRRMIAAACAEE